MVVPTPMTPVSETVWGMEYSVHECPRRHHEYVADVFPGVDLQGLLIVPTCQRSEMDLVQMGERVEDEKDRLLRRFMAFAKEVCGVLQLKGHWADYIDPCSGLPMINRSSEACTTK